jgi:hypothetical protein
MKKQTLFSILGTIILTSACTLSAGSVATPTTVDPVGTIVAATMQALTAAPSQDVSTPIPNPTGGIPVS